VADFAGFKVNRQQEDHDMSVAAVEFYYALRLMGISFTVAGDNLVIEAPPGVLTDEMRQQLGSHKPDLIAALIRREEVMERITLAKEKVEARAPGKLNWGTDTAESEAASIAVGEAMYSYVAGVNKMEVVEKSFRAWIRTLEKVKREAEVV